MSEFNPNPLPSSADLTADPNPAPEFDLQNPVPLDVPFPEPPPAIEPPIVSQNPAAPAPNPQAAEADLAKAAEPNPPKPDFSDFPEHERALFNQASIKARTYFAEKLRAAKALEEEHKKLQQQLEEARQPYYLNPEAVVLHPDYKRHEKTIQIIESIALPHWQQQLANLRNGEPAYGLVQDAQGNIFRSQEPLPPENQTEAYIISTLAQLGQARYNSAQQIESLRNSFKSDAAGFYSAVQKLNETFLPNPPPLLKAEIEKKIASLPPFVQKNPEYELLAKLLVVNTALSNELNRYKAAEAEKLKQQQGPRQMASAPARNPTEITREEFLRLTNGI